MAGKRKRRKTNAEFAETLRAQRRGRVRKSWKGVTLDRKNPPFPQRTRKGWGTLKYGWPAALGRKRGHLKVAATLFGGGDA